jgi:hypothetical protein
MHRLDPKVDRYSKMRREKEEVKYAGMYYNFEVFHMREKQVTISRKFGPIFVVLVFNKSQFKKFNANKHHIYFIVLLS